MPYVILQAALVSAQSRSQKSHEDNMSPVRFIALFTPCRAWAVENERMPSGCDSEWWITFAIATAVDGSSPSDAVAWPQSTEQTSIY